jgi:hypothetical protein
VRHLASQQKKFAFSMLLAVSLLAIASVALSIYIVNQPQQSVTTYLQIGLQEGGTTFTESCGPGCIATVGNPQISTAATFTIPPSDTPAVGFAKILVIIFVGAAIALVVAYAIIEHTKPLSRDMQTNLKQFTAPLTKPAEVPRTRTKLCANCGNSLASDANFCNECGSKQVD